MGNPMELPRIISVDDHVVEPPHLWETWLPEQVPRPRAQASSGAASASMKHIGGGTYEQTFDPDGPAGRLLGLRGPRLHRTSATSPPSASTATT